MTQKNQSIRMMATTMKYMLYGRGDLGVKLYMKLVVLTRKKVMMIMNNRFNVVAVGNQDKHQLQFKRD